MKEKEASKNYKEFPFDGYVVARNPDDKKLVHYKNDNGVFALSEGYEWLGTMFLLRETWIRYIILPKTLRKVERHVFIPQRWHTGKQGVVLHSKSDYRYPSEYAQSAYSPVSLYPIMEQYPLGVVIKNPKTIFDPNAFGDGKEKVAFYLEFNSDYDVSELKSQVTVYKKGMWKYIDGVPTPNVKR